MATIQDDRNMFSLTRGKAIKEGRQGCIRNIIDTKGSTIIRNDCFIIAIWLSSCQIASAGTMTTIVKKNLISIGNSWIMNKKCLESLKNCCACSLLVGKHAD